MIRECNRFQSDTFDGYMIVLEDVTVLMDLIDCVTVVDVMDLENESCLK